MLDTILDCYGQKSCIMLTAILVPGTKGFGFQQMPVAMGAVFQKDATMGGMRR